MQMRSSTHAMLYWPPSPAGAKEDTFPRWSLSQTAGARLSLKVGCIIEIYRYLQITGLITTHVPKGSS